ncbi:MAG: 4'-phosphopantetheinyl transferase [Gemmobacter sp.]
MLPPAVTVGSAAVGAAAPWPEETAALPRAVPRRIAEFAAGRAAARDALAGLGLPPVVLPRGADRLPVWPDGIRGSISHCATLAIAAATRADLWPGLDVEPDAALPADLIPVIATPAEIGAGLTCHAARRLFSAKEAAFKAQFPATRVWLDFQDLAVTFQPDGSFTARLVRAVGGPAVPGPMPRLPRGHRLAGHWAVRGGLIVTAVMLPGSGHAG